MRRQTSNTGLTLVEEISSAPSRASQQYEAGAEVVFARFRLCRKAKQTLQV